jgi:CRP-like cAMP-binding protein
MSEQAENDPNDGLRERLQKQGEDALGQFAQQLMESPLVHRALAGAFDAREKAAQAQEAAMGALNLPSAADIERVTRRLRSLSQRLEGIEDSIDRLEERLAGLAGQEPLGAVEQRLEEIARDLAALRESVAPSDAPMSRAQERLTVTE